jgi:hypothetical protein
MEFSKAVSELPITPKISKAVYILAEPCTGFLEAAENHNNLYETMGLF